MPITKAYTLYFFSQNNSCIIYFGVDGTSKAKVLKMGKKIAEILFDYYKSEGMESLTKITVKAEEYKPNHQ